MLPAPSNEVKIHITLVRLSLPESQKSPSLGPCVVHKPGFLGAFSQPAEF